MTTRDLTLSWAIHGVRVNSQDHGRLQVYTSKNTQTEGRQQEELNSRDEVQQLCFTTSVLTTMKSPQLLSTE